MRIRNPFRVLLFGGGAFFIFALSVFLFSIPPKSVVAAGTAAPAPAVGAPLFFHEIHIADNGLVLLRSAQVTAMNGTSMTVGTAWGSANLLWIVRTNARNYGKQYFGTRFLNRAGQDISPQEVHVGDLVTITGMLDSTAQEPTLDADAIRSLEE